MPVQRPGLVVRTRLLDRLRTAEGFKLTLISAPAGFGKTSLVGTWARDVAKPAIVAWISLDQEDNDRVRFWLYFVEALKTSFPGAANTVISMLRSPEPFPMESVLIALINGLSGSSNDIFVILDDYHFIKTGLIHEDMVFLLEHLPPKTHLLIVTRTTPPLPLARFRGQGTLLEIGADDLRFTTEEASALFGQIAETRLAPEDVAAINTRTEGWAVGLAIAALSISKQNDLRRFFASFTGSQRYVMDYLLEEVLKQQPVEIQDFLLRTSILERLTGTLCERLTGQGKSRQILADLEKALGGFLVPLDQSGQWYRYHPLFADLLYHQLLLQLGQDEAAVLHLRASQWFEDSGLTGDAIKHALKGRDWAKGICLIESAAKDMMRRGEMLTLAAWLRSIPEDYLRSNGPLYRTFVDTLISTGQGDVAEQYLARFEQSNVDTPSERGKVMLLRANLAWMKGDLQAANDLSRGALALLPPENVEERTKANWIIGRNAMGAGFLLIGETALTEAFEGAIRIGDKWVAGGALSLIGAIIAERGDLDDGIRVLRRAVELCEGSPAAAMPECSLSHSLYERNNLQEAVMLQEKVIGLCRMSGDYQVLTAGYSFLAYSKLAQGDCAAAKEALMNAQTYASADKVGPAFRAQVAAYGGLMAIRLDDKDAFERWRAELTEYESALPMYLNHVPARLLIARGEMTAASEVLKAKYREAVENKMRAHELKFRVYQALASSLQDASVFLDEALNLGQSEGFVRTFVDEGRYLAPLLRNALRRGVTSDYTAMLLNTIGLEARQQLTSQASLERSDASGILSERELEILRLLSDGKSNRDIGNKLFVTSGTVKVHIHNLMAKLNARSRTEAVAIARKQKIL
jgi:LuxR family maltose regulon positive regulatory protein